MSREHRAPEELTREDRALLHAIDTALQPEPMSAARAAEFQQRILQRIDEPGRTAWFQWAPPLVATAAAALAVWLLLPEKLPISSEDLVALVYPVDDGVESDTATDGEWNAYLPEEYQVLSDALETEVDGS